MLRAFPRVTGRALLLKSPTVADAGNSNAVTVTEDQPEGPGPWCLVGIRYGCE